jgi:hypothetical protein
MLGGELEAAGVVAAAAGVRTAGGEEGTCTTGDDEAAGQKVTVTVSGTQAQGDTAGVATCTEGDGLGEEGDACTDGELEATRIGKLLLGETRTLDDLAGLLLIRRLLDGDGDGAAPRA